MWLYAERWDGFSKTGRTLNGSRSGDNTTTLHTGRVLPDCRGGNIAVLRRRAPSYREREAYAEDVLLLIEVADTSLTYDRTTKLRLYAEAGIAEYWIVDCTTESVEVYRNPAPTAIAT